MSGGIYPVQPFFLVNTTKYYKMKVPSSEIVHFYSFEANAERVHAITAVPDGSVDLFFTFGDGIAEGRVYGTVTKNRQIEVRGGYSYFGVRFAPGCMPDKIDIAMRDLVNDDFSLRDFRWGDELTRRLSECGDFRTRTTLLRRYLGDEWRRTGILGQLISCIERGGGNVKVSDLENETLYSARYLNKVFTRELGVSPKGFAKFVRFQLLLGRMNVSGSADGARLAAEFGYFDQSHMIKEFKAFVGVTPREYLGAVDLPHYGSNIVLV
jgi:AraC-like DNA-binding protein